MLRAGEPRAQLFWGAAVVVLAVALRFGDLGTQSLWADEGYTARIAASSLASAASQVPHTESTPPLYYAAIWLWAHVFGDSAAALRSLSALFGCLTVLVAYRFTALLAGRRVALVASALAATNPLMVWYSQEARAYALFVLLSVAALGFFLLALREPRRAWLLGWALASALALATHYFTLFPLVVELGWLLHARRTRRAVLAAAAVPIATGIALLPLALYQKAHVPRPWTSLYTVADQAKAIAQSFFIGPTWTPLIHRLGLALLVLLALAAVYAVARGADASERRLAAELAALAALTLLLPLLISLAGPNYLAPRNVLYAWPMLAGVAALGAARRTAGRASSVLVIAACAVSVAIVLAVASTAALQRDDWRGLLASLGRARAARVMLVLDGFTNGPVVRYYLAGLRPPGRAVIAREVDVVGEAQPVLAAARRPPFAGLVASSVEIRRHIGLARFAVPQGLPVSARSPAVSGARIFVQQPG